MVKFRNPFNISPPGCNEQILSHPKQKFGVMELAVFQDHRYAFFYWLKWQENVKNTQPPCLVTLDWHQDLCFPCDTEKQWLSELDQSNNGEVAVFSWTKLCGNNDGHILSAAYLDLIGNIYVYCRQGDFAEDWDDETFLDVNGKEHKIKKFKTFDALEKHLLQSKEEKVFFDIDLDFFTKDNPYNGKGDVFTYVTDEEFEQILSIQRPLIDWIFNRIEGFTIATEPKHTGGLLMSNHFLEKISRLYFDPDLFTQNCDWRHTIKF